MASVGLGQYSSMKKCPPFWEECRSVLIFGAGNMGKDVFRVLAERGISVAGFLDRRAQGDETWNGVPVLQPDDECISLEDRKQAGVIMAIHNRDVEVPPITKKLRSLGYGRIITLIELYDWVGKELGNRFWLTSRDFYAGREPLIAAASDLWADEASRALYAATIRFRLTGDYSVLPAPDRQHQYFPPELPAWKTPLRFVDCGAFDGDTLVSFINAGIPIESVAAFEPDPVNFGKLANLVRANRLLTDVALWPCGVGPAVGQVRFAAGKGEGSAQCAEGAVVVQCVSLDEAIPNFAPTLIKMDIEGAEYAALLGARRTIARYRPNLAISVYHRPEDIWQIPLLLARTCGTGEGAASTYAPIGSADADPSFMPASPGSYQFFLRSHGYSGFELVLYAIPI
jgi:FkbM family methyltransferase